MNIYPNVHTDAFALISVQCVPILTATFKTTYGVVTELITGIWIFSTFVNICKTNPPQNNKFQGNESFGESTAPSCLGICFAYFCRPIMRADLLKI